jgi:hypothetical protein
MDALDLVFVSSLDKSTASSIRKFERGNPVVQTPETIALSALLAQAGMTDTLAELVEYWRGVPNEVER